MSSLKKNIIYQITYQILLLVIPLITSPYISRVLKPEGVGVYSYTTSVASYFILFSMLGINNYGNREIAKAKDNMSKLSYVFSSILYLHLFISLIVIICFLIYVFMIDNTLYMYLQIPYVLSAILDINWFYFGIEKFDKVIKRNLFIKTGTLALIFLFVKNSNDLWIYITIMSISIFMSQAIIWINLKKYVQFKIVDFNSIIKHLKPMITLFIPVIAISLYRTMDKIMLGIMSNSAEVGYYENADKIIRFPMGLITAFGIVLMPRIANCVSQKKYEEKNKYTQLSTIMIMIISYAISFGLSGISDDFSVVFWGNEFEYCGVLIAISAIAIPFLAIADIVRSQYLVPYSKDKEYIVSVTLGACVNVFLNLILIPKQGALGATISTVITEGVVCFSQLILVIRKFKIIRYIIQTAPFILIGVVMYFIVKYVGEKFETGVITLVVEILVGVITYLILGGIFFLKCIKIYKNHEDI